jgi:hypothetical protein
MRARGAGTERVSVQWFLDHLLGAGAVEFGAIVVEVAAVIVLAVLLYVTREDGSARAPDDRSES